MNILILVNPTTLHVSFVKDYIRSFELFSEHDVQYASHLPYSGSDRKDGNYSVLHRFDAVVITFHLRVCFDGWVSSGLNRELRKFRGKKVLFLQDEYERTEYIRRWIEEHGIHLVYTVVPEEYVSVAYPPEYFPNTVFRTVFTGYAPIRRRSRSGIPSIENRPFDVIYRAKISPPWLGELVMQKAEIGRYFKQVCRENGLSHDIEWDEYQRIYGQDWHRFLRSGRVTLGTESGANVFDEFGKIRKYFEEEMEAGKERDEIEPPARLNYREGNIGVRMNQISPRLFEAITDGTALVLYEGVYSGVLDPGRHYVPLKHDHSNIDEVVEAVKNADYLQGIADRAYEEIIESGRYDYTTLVRQFDEDLKRLSDSAPTASETSAIGVSMSDAQPAGESLITGDFSDLSATGAAFHFARSQTQKEKLLETRQKLKVDREKLNAVREKLNTARRELRSARERLKQAREALRRKNRELGEIKQSRAYRIATSPRKIARKLSGR